MSSPRRFCIRQPPRCAKPSARTPSHLTSNPHPDSSPGSAVTIFASIGSIRRGNRSSVALASSLSVRASVTSAIMGRVLFELDDVSYSRGGHTVLDGLSARIPRGASCLFGPSGSGKSTTLRLLDRLIDPDRGRVLYEGSDVRDRDVLELRREVCLVPQLPALAEGSVADNVAYGPRMAGQSFDSRAPLELAGWRNAAHELEDAPGGFWSFSGATHTDRRDWVQPVDADFNQRNTLAMDSSDYGGGTPVADLWRRDGGLAVGHVEAVPRLLDMPVRKTARGASIALESAQPATLPPGGTLTTERTLLCVHGGDFYAPLELYRGLLGDQGIAARAFERVFQLADHVQVKSANLENGLLHVDLVREIPEAKKPRKIPIGNGQVKAEVINAKAAA